MPKNILFIIDDLELKYFEFNDLITDFWLIKEFLKRDNNVSIAIKSDLFIEKAQGCVFSRTSYLKNENIFYNKETTKHIINDFDVVFFRSDPPVDINYINACYVFDYVNRSKTMLINDPSEIRNFNEKFHINYFPEFTPENIVTSNSNFITRFVEKHKEAILKPLNKCFGSEVYYLNYEDKNLLTIIKNMTEDDKRAVMVQEYLNEAKFGDKRVLIIGDKVMEECIQKLPAEHNFKFAEHSDQYFRKTLLTDNERKMAESIARKLSKIGLYLVGIDVINEKAIEINVTSPCYFIREINKNYGICFENTIMAHLETLIENYFERIKPYAFNK